MRSFITAAVFCFAVSINIAAQSNLLTELIDLPAPAAIKSPKNDEPEKIRPPEFFNKNRVPADDAPIEELLDYWSVQNRVGELDFQPEISDISMQRILEYCRDAPKRLPDFLSLLEKKTGFADTVKSIYDAGAESEKFNPYWGRQINEWLTYNTTLYTDRLIVEARKVKDQGDRDTENEKELFALTKVDWNSAQPILERLAADKTQPFSSVSALWAFYQHALDTNNESDAAKYRADLQAIVADREAEPGVRDKAVDALVLTKHWEGREEWYGSLLGDESLLKMQESGFTGLTTLIRHSPPGAWTDAMIKLVGNKNPSVHNAAVRNLISMLDETRPEIAVALVPWLSEPNWAKESDDGERKDLIEYVGENDIPEAVPGLIWIVTNDEEFLLDAARSLVRYKSSQAIPALRTALQKEGNEQRRTVLIEAVVASGGLTIAEQIAAVEAYAAFISTPEGAKTFEQMREEYEYDGEYDDEDEDDAPAAKKVKTQTLPLNVSFGGFVARMEEPSDQLIWNIIERRKALLKTKPAIALILTDILKNWQGRAADLFRLSEIKNNSADKEIVLKVLTARKNLRETMPGEIAQMRDAKGAAGGFAACLTETEMDLANAFRSGDIDTRTAVLACARLVRGVLPVAEVGGLLKNPNKTLALAAERYLETVDTHEARNLIWAARPNEAVILGARTTFNPAKQPLYNSSLIELFRTVGSDISQYNQFEEFDKQEEKLQKEILASPDLLTVYAYGDIYIRVYRDRAVFAFYEDESRFRERNLTKEEFESFQNLLREKNISDVSPRYDCVTNESGNCYGSQFLMLNRNGGRRIFGYAPFAKGIGELNQLFFGFLKTEGKLRYELEKHVSGLEVVVADSRFSIKSVWKNGDDFRALTLDKIKETEKLKEFATAMENVNPSDYGLVSQIVIERAKQMKARELENYAWQSVGKDGKIGANAAEPEQIPFLRNRLEIPFDAVIKQSEFGWKVKSGNFQIRTGIYGNNGLLKINRTATTKLFEGEYDSPLVSEDGKWAIVIKYDQNGYRVGRSLMRVDLTANRQYKINLPEAVQMEPVAFVAAHRKFIVKQLIKDQNSDKLAAQYLLVDAATGTTQPVKGEFRPLEQQTYRALQPTGKPDEFWAAISEENATNLGIYNAKTFTFKSLLKIPEIKLTSMDVWVDELAGKIFFVYEGTRKDDGHLLSLPLPK